MKIRLITFDLDNTLWATDEVIRRATLEMQNWVFERVPRFRDVGSADQNQIQQLLLNERPEISHDVSLVRIAFLERVFTHLGIPHEKGQRLALAAFDVFLHWRNKVDPYPGVLVLLRKLGRAYTLAALTNGNADIHQTALRDCFDFALCAADVGAAKPDPAMFQAALQQATSDPQTAIHIGDNPLDDIQGAANAGMHSIWVDFNATGQNVTASRTVHTIAEINSAIKSLESNG